MKIHHEDTKTTNSPVILSEAKDLVSKREALAAEARSFASLRMTPFVRDLRVFVVKNLCAREALRG